MRRFAFVFFAFILISQASNVFSQGNSLADFARSERVRRSDMEKTHSVLVKEVLEQSGVRQLLEQVGTGFTSSSEEQLKQLPPEIRQQLKQAVSGSFDASKLMPIFEHAFALEMDIVSLEEVSRWYETPVGQRVISAEKTADSRKLSGDSRLPGAAPGRAQLIQQLEVTTRGTERTVAVLAAMTKSMLTRILDSAPEAAQIKGDFIRGFEAGFTATAVPGMRGPILASYASAYSPLSDDELQDYISFLASRAGRRFMNATWNGLQKAMAEGGTEIGARFSEILRQKSATAVSLQ